MTDPISLKTALERKGVNVDLTKMEGGDFWAVCIDVPAETAEAARDSFVNLSTPPQPPQMPRSNSLSTRWWPISPT